MAPRAIPRIESRSHHRCKPGGAPYVGLFEYVVLLVLQVHPGIYQESKLPYGRRNEFRHRQMVQLEPQL